MNISKIKPILEAAKLADDSVLLEGLHGIGKSEIVKQYTDENGYFYTVLFLSHQEVGDLIGIPVTKEVQDESLTIWSKPIWLQRMDVAAANGKHCVLLLDELNRAQADVLNSALQLVLERQIHEHFLPTVNGIRTQVIACTNPGDGDYHVHSFDPALLDRFLKIDVEVDPESWLEWARKNNVNEIVRAFIVDNMTKLHFTPDNADEVGASPRSWTKLAKFVDLFDTIPSELHLNIIRGKIGSALGSEFYLFCENYDSNISISDIEKFVKKEFKKEKDFGLLGEKLKDYIGEMESITKLEHANTLFDRDKEKFLEDSTKNTDFLALYGMLYSFEIETLTSFLKDKKANEKEYFYAFMKKDSDRELARKIKSKANA